MSDTAPEISKFVKEDINGRNLILNFVPNDIRIFLVEIAKIWNFALGQWNRTNNIECINLGDAQMEVDQVFQQNFVTKTNIG